MYGTQLFVQGTEVTVANQPHSAAARKTFKLSGWGTMPFLIHTTKWIYKQLLIFLHFIRNV